MALLGEYGVGKATKRRVVRLTQWQALTDDRKGHKKKSSTSMASPDRYGRLSILEIGAYVKDKHKRTGDQLNLPRATYIKLHKHISITILGRKVAHNYTRCYLSSDKAQTNNEAGHIGHQGIRPLLL